MTDLGLDLDPVLAALAGQPRSTPVALVLVPTGIGLAVGSVSFALRGDPAALVQALETALDPRWVCWDAGVTLTPLVAAGLRLRACWDVAAVHRLLCGGLRGDAGAAWAAVHQLAEPAQPSTVLDLLDLASSTGSDRVA